MASLIPEVTLTELEEKIARGMAKSGWGSHLPITLIWHQRRRAGISIEESAYLMVAVAMEVEKIYDADLDSGGTEDSEDSPDR